MSDTRACYRSLHRYKYQLVQNYTQTIEPQLDRDIETPFIDLTAAGQLTIRSRYAWDGPSGPTVDTLNFMRGSLVHDALYQLMREKQLDHQKHRLYADVLLREMCRQDGMSGFRAAMVYYAVRGFGEKSARPPETPRDKVICAPA